MEVWILCLRLLFAGIMLPLALAACSTPEIQSAWRDRTITVDGSGDEWNNALASYFDESRVLLGVTNDYCDLYLRLSTSDADLQRRLLHDGCTVWFDGNGGESKVFGLRYPLGRPMMPPPLPRKGAPGAGNEPMGGMLAEAQEQVEILRPGSEAASQLLSLPEANKLGIELRMSVGKGLLVYEVKVPLAGIGCDPFAVTQQGAKSIGVGFAAGERAGGDRPPGGGPGGFTGGGGGRPGGDFSGGGGRRPPPGGKSQEPFELWTKVVLALAPR